MVVWEGEAQKGGHGGGTLVGSRASCPLAPRYRQPSAEVTTDAGLAGARRATAGGSCCARVVRVIRINLVPGGAAPIAATVAGAPTRARSGLVSIRSGVASSPRLPPAGPYAQQGRLDRWVGDVWRNDRLVILLQRTTIRIVLADLPRLPDH